MKQALIYSLKVWLTTIVVGSLVMGIRIYFLYDWVYDRLENAFKVPEIGIPMGIILYLPSGFIMGVATWYLNKKIATVLYGKIYLSLIAGILSLVPFIIMDYRALFVINTGLFAGFPPDLFWTCAYLSISIAAIWIYKLKPSNG